MRKGTGYQVFLIAFALLLSFGVFVFIYKEMNPEYKVYQRAYKQLEEFKAELTREPAPPFEFGIKQIMIPDPDNGPEVIDRCTSCHLATNLPHFAKERIATDINGQPVVNQEGLYVMEPNPNYIFEQLKARNPKWYEKLKTQKMEKVLAAHPLIGAETTPFEYHSLDEIGCTSCHSGNGRALVSNRAHGPVYDEDYHPADMGYKPAFLEIDEENDPAFARMYNHKPGHDLVFQTTPVFAGSLITAKCMQCHESSSETLQSSFTQIENLEEQKLAQVERLQKSIQADKAALHSAVVLYQMIQEKGREETIQQLEKMASNYHLSVEETDAYGSQLSFLKEHEETEFALLESVEMILGPEDLSHDFLQSPPESLDDYVASLKSGPLASKIQELAAIQPTLEVFERAKQPLFVAGQDQAVLQGMKTHLDTLLVHYERGKELFVSQACYACHRIAGFSRSSVGPELTEAGMNYPWYIKESIVWPQADLPSSTMPNFHLDHEEVADLMTFLMAQTGNRKVESEVDHQIAISEWESGKKVWFEKPVPPTKIEDVKEGMLVFAEQGCAACHRLQGFDTGYTVPDEKLEWFTQQFPSDITGSDLATRVMREGEAIDANITKGHEGSLIEQVEKRHPGLIKGYYSNFQFAKRKYGDDLQYQERLDRVLMGMIELYGLGRLIGPPLNWSGVYRNDAWLMGHFKNPAAYVARSIMPVLPFDESKFYMLTHMLNVLGKQNTDSLQLEWKEEGFNPSEAYSLLCANCHGDNRQGNGPVAEWIYPIPKNLRDPQFLRGLTKEQARLALLHGVEGTPMPPWGAGEHPVLTEEQIDQMVDWLYKGLPDQVRVTPARERWDYSLNDVVSEMEAEKHLLQPSAKPVSPGTYFIERPNIFDPKGRPFYYIRPEFYTDENLAQGRAFYNVHCAVCHGKDGGGTGDRAPFMNEAKPRMLTNLPWIQSRDDLRLLQSLKYGVPGTSMVAWGDQTNSALRMQLVMVVREFSRQQVLREQLNALVYDTFEQRELAITKLRVPNYEALEAVHTQQKKQVIAGKCPEKSDALVKLQAVDDHYIEWLDLIKQERQLYKQLGEQLIVREMPERVVRSYFVVVRERATTADALIAYLDEEIKKNQPTAIPESDPLGDQAAQAMLTKQRGYINLRTQVLTSLAKVKTLQEKQERYDNSNSL